MKLITIYLIKFIIINQTHTYNKNYININSIHIDGFKNKIIYMNLYEYQF